MTIAYPLTAQADYTELKYSLRSIDKHYPGHDIVIVGERLPSWITGVTQIMVRDIKGRKQLSIRKKILAALHYADEILCISDDVYLLEDTDSFPYFWQGDLKAHVSESGARILMNELLAIGKPVKDFNGHYPAVFKKDFRRISETFSGDCILKSMYANYLEVEGQLKRDNKMVNDKINPREFIKDLHCFSTGAQSLKSALPLLQELFPYPSKYEI